MMNAGVLDKRPYLKIGRASELSGNDRIIYRILEMLPGFLMWFTIIGVVFLSWFKPVWVALFIIVFDVYWLIKTAYLSLHLRANWQRMKSNIETDWHKRLMNMKWQHLYQMVLLPFYKEDFGVIEDAVVSILNSDWPKEKMIIILASEERAGATAAENAKKIFEKYGDKFAHFLITKHPKNIPGEMAGKGSNIAFAAEEARKEILDKNNIPYEDVLVSAFDIDTRVYPKYFLCLTWHFLTAEKPYKSSYQPVPLYNNNIWQSPALSRVVATSGTFWQMIQQERPERLATFSSHSIPFKALYEIGYWQKNMVSEDSRIFWNFLLFYDGDYRVVPLSYPVSMDANLAPSFWRTSLNVYKQQRRWTWGVENVPYILFGFLKNKSIPLAQKLRLAFVQIEGFWSLSTNPLLIFMLGWLPLALGGQEFNNMLLSYNLPRITRLLMTIAMLGLVGSAILSFKLLPKRPDGKKFYNVVYMFFQWVLIPFTIIVFGAIPGVDSQTRLLLGKYMGFWVTPKYRK
ncbi:MAG: glycosyltransferase family 2 protein [Candidatus Pacebacteria bacterium]|nr:glycosyltransferase family 2 protein [Candidatus Paceibacterota bacterium]